MASRKQSYRKIVVWSCISVSNALWNFVQRKILIFPLSTPLPTHSPCSINKRGGKQHNTVDFLERERNSIKSHCKCRSNRIETVDKHLYHVGGDRRAKPVSHLLFTYSFNFPSNLKHLHPKRSFPMHTNALQLLSPSNYRKYFEHYLIKTIIHQYTQYSHLKL